MQEPQFPNFQLDAFRLDGRAALLTGAGRGIGLGIAQALAAAGCAVAVQDVNEDVAASAVAEIEQRGGRAIALGGDVTDVTLPRRLIEQAVERLGGLQILVNNAAIQRQAPWREMEAGEVERTLRANVVAPLELCREAVPLMQAAGYGRILNLGSLHGRGGTAKMLPYGMSKAALENMTRALARDLAPDGITVNLIAPGYFDTWRNRDDWKTAEDKAATGRRIPMGRIGEPSDCAGLALLLCSPAGSYITGQSIAVDGGSSAR